MDLRATLQDARAFAEHGLLDRCRVVALGTVVMDQATGRDSRPELQVLADGPCLVAERDVEPDTADAGERTVYEHGRVVHLPAVASGAVQVGHVVVVTACASDPSLVGRRLLVRAVSRGSLLSRRALYCEEVTG